MTSFIDELPEPPHPPTIPHLLRWAAYRWGERELLVAAGGRLTFTGLEARSADLALALLRAGVGKGAHVGILMGNSPDWLVCFFAVARIGAVAVPLSTFFQPRELAWVIAHADLQLLLVADQVLGHDLLARLEAALPDLCEASPPYFLRSAPFLRAVYVWGVRGRSWSRSKDELIAAGGAPCACGDLLSVEHHVSAADRAFIVYTSGSTAEPKGVVHTHGPFVRHTYGLAHTAWPYDHNDRIASTRPFFWIAGLASLLMYAIHRGACIVATIDLNYEALAELVRRERITGLVGREAWLRGLVGAPPVGLAPYSIIPIGYCLAGVARETLGRGLQFENPMLEARFPAASAHLAPEQAHRALGMTEMIGPETHELVFNRLPTSKVWSSGRAVPGVDLILRDLDSDARFSVGEGELLVRGGPLTAGLYKRERTETFTRDGYYPTGDVVRMDEDGHLFFKRRRDDLLKVRSANVAPAEVELVLNQLPGVVESAVFLLGPAEAPRLAAIVVSQENARQRPDELRRALRQQLSTFKVPEVILFALASDLPRTGSGKIKRTELAPRAEQLLARQGDAQTSSPGF